MINCPRTSQVCKALFTNNILKSKKKACALTKRHWPVAMLCLVFDPCVDERFFR